MSVLCTQTIRPAAPLRPLAAALLVLLATSGCKTGTATSKPSWWAFGGTDAAKLASAPAYDKGAIEKPSATSKPYPVTSTPQSYSLAAGQAAPAVDVAATPPAVTYGTTPAPARSQPAPAAVPEPAQTADARQPAPLASITPQVGPYTNLPGEPPAGGGATEAGGDRFRAAPPDRYADARPSDSWSAPAAPPQQAASSRYGDAAGSRFAGGQQPAEVPLQGVPPAATTMPAVPARPAGFSATEPPAAVSGPPPGGSGFGGVAVDPAVVPAAPATLPALSPSPSTPVPPRRNDPLYRPAGTSSYRPGREILVGGGAEADAAVRQVNFETPPPAN
jgi:hypothetical protein